MVINIKLRYRIVLFVIGIYLSSNGLFFLTIYSSYLNMGYSFADFVKLISNKLEVYLLFIGFIFALLGMFLKKKD